MSWRITLRCDVEGCAETFSVPTKTKVLERWGAASDAGWRAGIPSQGDDGFALCPKHLAELKRLGG